MSKKILFCFVVCLWSTSGVWAETPYPKPKGESGAKADALARAVEKAIDIDAWKKTGVIAWTFAGRRTFLWDRRRQLVRANWGKGAGKVEAFFSLSNYRLGVATQAGKLLTGQAKKKALKRGFAVWCNDSFWLNPMAKLFDIGTIRKRILQKDKEHLLVEYKKGGVTPGDSYFYILDKNALPLRWRMYVKIIPTPGVMYEFVHWKKLSTGAIICTRYKRGKRFLNITNVKAANTLSKLFPKDPFVLLLAKK